MLILSVDTSTRTGSAALLRDEIALGSWTSPTDERYSTSLSDGVQGLLRAEHVDIREIDVFAVAAGPGSFTGLRVGLTATKAWAEALGKPVVAVSVLEAIAGESVVTRAPGPILLAPVLDARRGQVFGGLYRVGETPGRMAALAEEVVLGFPEFLDYARLHAAGRPFRLVSPTPEAIGIASVGGAELRIEVEGVSPVLALAIGKVGFRKATAGDLTDAVGLDANYVRRSDAEMHWKES